MLAQLQFGGGAFQTLAWWASGNRIQHGVRGAFATSQPTHLAVTQQVAARHRYPFDATVETMIEIELKRQLRDFPIRISDFSVSEFAGCVVGVLVFDFNFAVDDFLEA